MSKTRIHFRLSDENYDFLWEFSRTNHGISLNRSLNILLKLAKSATEQDPQFLTRWVNTPEPERNRDDSIEITLRWQVWERDNFTCKGCGARTLLSIDHIQAKSKGGLTVLENLQTLCRKCNSKKGTRTQVAPKLDTPPHKS